QQGYSPLVPCNHIQNANSDLPDMTPHWLLHHPLFHTYLAAQLPNIPYPMAMDLHLSLANLDHLDAIINTAIKLEHPEGTGWNG
ncbi:hypothetical protein ARMGADRAFT_905044, partial [Armillaria gallica]